MGVFFIIFARTMQKYFFVFACAMSCALLTQTACLETSNPYPFAAPGMWRGVLTLEDPDLPVGKKGEASILYDQFKPGEVPFNFEVVYTSPERFYINLINGEDRVRCDSIRTGRDRTTARDTFNVYFPEYQSYLHAEVRGGAMQGYWIKGNDPKTKLAFVADAGKDYRFTSLKETPQMDLTGTWATLIGIDSDRPMRALGEFKQEGNKLTGTFRTESGDFRFLEGTVQGRRFWLSAFDGAAAYLFSGNIQGDSLQGEFRSGKKPPKLWTAWKDPSFQLGDPHQLTSTTGSALAFQYTTPEGNAISFPGTDFDQKIGIISITGTWCPNCKDEQLFLKQWMEEHPDLAKQIKVLGVSFERSPTSEAANAQLMQYKKTLGLPFDLVYGGPADAVAAAKAFPALDKVMAFPTLLIVDKKGAIRKIHTGFDGPATSKYTEFKQRFTTLMTELSQE